MADNNSVIKQITVNESTIGLVKSANVKVFPCAYRGYYQQDSGIDTITTKVFDPEARGYTEYNFSNHFGKLGNRKHSYIVSWEVSNDETETYKSTLKCVIGGYYFELYDIKLEDFVGEGNAVKRLAIRTKDVTLANEPDDSERKTKILDSFVESTNYMDISDDGVYLFSGLALLDDSAQITTSDSLYPFALKEIDGVQTAVVNQAAYGIQDVLDAGEGAYSLKRLGGEREDSGYYDGAATGAYSLAFGKSSEASGESSTAFGDETIANGDNSFAIGRKTKATGNNSFAAGEGVVSSKANGTVIGKYNYENDKVFVVGWGTQNAGKNIFEIDESGNVTAAGGISAKGALTLANATTNVLTLGGNSSDNSGKLLIYGDDATLALIAKPTGNLTISGAFEAGKGITAGGSIVANGDGVNTLQLGDETADKSGEIRIYGTGSDKVFSVSNAGVLNTANNAEIGGDLKVTNNTTINGTCAVAKSLTIGVESQNEEGTELTVHGDASLSGAVTISGKTTIDKATTIKGALSATAGAAITGKLTVSDTLTVAEGKLTTLKGGVTTTSITASGAIMTTDGVKAKSLQTANGDDIVAEIKDTGELSARKTLTVFSETIPEGSQGREELFKVNADGNVEAKGAITFGGATLTANEDNVTLNKELTINDKLTIAKEGSISVSINTNSAELPKTTITGDLEVKGNIDLGGFTISNDSTTGASTLTAKGTFMLNEGCNIIAGGDIQAHSYIATSDARKKTNIEPFALNPAQSVLNLNTYKFEFKDDPTHKKHIGCLAQELQAICPELVHEDDDGFLAIEEGKLVYLLLNEVKSLKAEIDELKKQIR